MASSISNQTAPGFSCPAGYDFYACEGGSLFFGCCSGTQPCVTGCPYEELGATSYDVGYYGSYPPFMEICEVGSQWYICPQNIPPFLGCCQNECCDVEIRGNLTAATRSHSGPFTVPGTAQQPGTTSSSSVTTSTSSATTSASSATTSSASALAVSSSSTGSIISSITASSSAVISTSSTHTISTSASKPSPTAASTSSSSLGAIVGGTVGGVAVLILAFAIAILFFYCLRRTNRPRQQPSCTETAPFGQEQYVPQGNHVAGTNNDEAERGPPPSYAPFNPCAAETFRLNPFAKRKRRSQNAVPDHSADSPQPPYELHSPRLPDKQNSQELSLANLPVSQPTNHSVFLEDHPTTNPEAHLIYIPPSFPYATLSRDRSSSAISELSVDTGTPRSPKADEPIVSPLSEIA